ncbi:MAG: tyrosine-type recombinase/integrase [Planctomycetales bacterium]|nr:tyrosine-type recombinase/integrase [Planctomycetales bacterium]
MLQEILELMRAERFAANQEDEAERRRTGIVSEDDVRAEQLRASSLTPFPEVVAEWKPSLQRAVKSDVHEISNALGHGLLLYENHEGQKLNVHSLRHTCGAWLGQAGVNIKTVQTVMRHKSIQQTLDTYGHLMPGMMDVAAKMGRATDTVAPKLRAVS